jgi:hypothetical protein
MHAEDQRQDLLARLRNELDTSTFKAALGVMLQETRTAIERVRARIALERLARRNTSTRMNQLQTLEEMQAMLVAARLRAGNGLTYADIDDDGQGTIVHLRVGGR